MPKKLYRQNIDRGKNFMVYLNFCTLKIQLIRFSLTKIYLNGKFLYVNGKNYLFDK